MIKAILTYPFGYRPTTAKAVILVLFLFTGIGVSADCAYAQSVPLQSRDACTTGSSFEIPNPGAGNGIITGIVDEVKNALDTVSEQMYDDLINDSNLQDAVSAAVILYIAVTGIMFTTGAMQVTVYEITIRYVKVMIVGLLLSDDSWMFFSDYVVRFFNDGTDEIINFVTGMAAGATPIQDQYGFETGGEPFAPLDVAISKGLSNKMVVTLMATFFSGPNGMLIGILMMTGLGSFLKSVINAMWVYLMALLLKAMMFGVAPLFIPCIMFNRTAHLFQEWLNQIVNACLQPIMLFSFFAFFIQLIVALIDHLIYTPSCWTAVVGGSEGGPITQHFWRFMVPGGPAGWQEFSGEWDFKGAAGATDEFPIRIMNVIMFVMVAELAVRFNSVVIEIAKDISGASTNLSGMGTSIKEWFTSAGGSEKPPESGGGAGAKDSRGNLPGSRAWQGAKPERDTSGNGLTGNGGLFGPGGRFSVNPPPGVRPAEPGAGGAGRGVRPGTGGGGGVGAPGGPAPIGAGGMPARPEAIVPAPVGGAPGGGLLAPRPIRPVGVGVGGGGDPVAELRRRIGRMPGGR